MRCWRGVKRRRGLGVKMKVWEEEGWVEEWGKEG
jgi:hypothetical protein